MGARIIRSGDVVECIEYDRPLPYDYTPEREISPRGEQGSKEDGKRDDNLLRARQKIRQYIWANQGKFPKFVTFTYADNMQDYEQFKADWYLSQKRMARQGIKLRYLYVLEYQQRGAIHTHAVLFNDEYIPHDKLAAAWGKGFVKINAIDSVRNLGAYVCKYLQKASMQEYGSYAYHISRGLNKPEVERVNVYESQPISDLEQKYWTTYDNTVYDETLCTFVRYRQFMENPK